MLVEFTKMNGAGNDFILLDNRSGQWRLTPEQVIRLCDRHRGVGADGVLLLEPSRTGRADWAWQFYNSDGSEAEMCGNGARCFARFVQRVTGADGRLTFETRAGIIEAELRGDRVTVGLTPPKDWRLDLDLETSRGPVHGHAVNTGVPHLVLLTPDVEQAPVAELGRELRRHPAFQPAGTNVNFVQILEPGHIRVRTYERGVEAETLACGTGVTASALVCARIESWPPPVKVRVQGGDTLEVAFTRDGDDFHAVRLTGPADFVFTGRIEI
ncbi:MAG: diaminopimelate epimerase [Verrucomicrobia bacterium]|nr:MAG: diaminopimelate epimerase [Verrucomicrobiota bacterium]